MALIVSIAASAGDLDEMRATRQKLIAARDSTKLPRDEVPLDTVAIAKRQLLHWAESRLQSFGRAADPGELTKALSKELDALKPASYDDLDRLGDLAVEFSRPAGESSWLQMSTDVGIPCGADRSVYLYEWRGDQWKRRFALETNDYRRAQYGPQNFVEVQVSSADFRGARLVLATGWPPACMSVWHTLYIRLFRVDASQAMLFEETPLANQGEDPAYSARLEPAGALIEFNGSSVDSGILIRKHVLRYAVEHDKVRRIEPIALSAQDFVEEWLTRPWAEIAAWSQPQLAERHNKLHKDFVSGDYQAVQRCTKPGEWQVSIAVDDKTSYFSLLDRGDYHFRMLDIRETPRPDCSGRNEILGLGDPKPTLFPKN